MNSMPKVDPTVTLDPLHLINHLPPMVDGSSIEIHTGCPDPFAFLDSESMHARVQFQENGYTAAVQQELAIGPRTEI